MTASLAVIITIDVSSPVSAEMMAAATKSSVKTKKKKKKSHMSAKMGKGNKIPRH